MSITSEQVRAARVFLKWDQATLAEKSGISLSTIKRMETFSGEVKGHADNIKLLQSTLEKAGIKFINNAEGIGTIELHKK